MIPVPADEEQAFSALFSDSTYDRAEFKLELTDHPPATYGPRVKTIKIFWKDGVIAEYGAADATSWVDQFRADWDSGLIPGILEERELRASSNCDGESRLAITSRHLVIRSSR